MVLIIIQVITLLIIFALLYLLTWFLPTDSPWSPWWTTSKEKSRALCKLVKLSKKDVFYELGSGTGTTLGVAGKEFGAMCIGIESDATRVWWAKQKMKRLGIAHNVTLLKGDFFKIPLSSPPASVVYLYLVPRVIMKLKKKLFKELKPGTKVVSYIYPIDYLPLVAKNVKEQLYMYEIPKKRS